MEELKICPFCGRNAAKVVRTPTSFGSLYYKVACIHCLANTSMYAYEKRAIKAWNRREKITQNKDIQKLKGFITEQKKIAKKARDTVHYGLQTPEDLEKKAWWKGVYDTLNMVENEITELGEEKDIGNST